MGVILPVIVCNMEKQAIGIIGLGNIGTAIVKGLIRNSFVNLFVNDIRREAGKELELLSSCITWCDTPSELASRVNILITALPKPLHVRLVMEEGKALCSLKKGSVWIDHTSTAPSEAIYFGKQCNQKSIRFLEAPLTGGLELLRQGIMTVLVGDDTDGLLMKEMESIMKSYTSNRLLLGRIGKASVVKIISNMLCAIHTVASAEALAIAVKLGVNPEAFFDGIRASAGNSYVFETEVPLFFNQTFDPGFTLELHNKDLKIGEQLANEVGVTNIPVMMAAIKTYAESMEKFGKEKGSSWPGALVEERNCADFAVDGWSEWSYSAQTPDDGRGGTGLSVKHSIKAKL